jgi:two-component system, OmpR family, response regulator BaeR
MNQSAPLAIVVEDYSDTAFIFQQALEMAGYETKVLSDGAEALRELENTVPALVVLDLHIPSVDGPALLKKIRTDPRLAKTRVILATADALLAQRITDQADMVLLKPISFTQLNQLAGRYFAHPKE